MRRASAILVTALATSLIGCEPGENRATAEIARSITNGAVDDGDPAVVALLSAGQAYCTGTVIAARWVLTAAHCLQPPLSPSEIYIGTSAATAGLRLAVARTIVHPRFSFIGLQNDLGLVELVEAAPVVPLPLMEQPLVDGFVGAPVRLVGFGSSSAVDTGSAVKRSGIGRVSALDPQDLMLAPAPSQPCLTDSGAPILAGIDGVERVVGVSSSGDARCEDHARAVRVDAFMDDFILPFTAAPGPARGCQSAPCGPGPALLILAVASFRQRQRRSSR